MAKDMKIYNVVVDIVVLLVTVSLLTLSYLSILHLVPIRDRGFFCNDPDIQYPYVGETIPVFLLLIVAFLPPIVAFFIGEPLFYVLFTRIHERRRQRCRPCKFTVNPIFIRLYQLNGLYFFGAALQFMFVMLCKRMVGSLRPHFIDTCQLDVSNCTLGGLTSIGVCTGDTEDIQDARESFPSGHASTAVYSMVFLTMYLEARLRWKGARLVKPFLQASCLLIACFCATSRIYDNRHRPVDVLWGSIIGFLLAFCMTYYVSDLFKKRKKIEEEDDGDEEMKSFRQYYRQKRRKNDVERYL
ncbi:phospholipid phosphatase 3-like [Glandiceps talaboti]